MSGAGDSRGGRTGEDDRGKTLAAFVRDQNPGVPWSQVKRWVASGKVWLDGAPCTDEARRLVPGQEVAVRQAAARPRDPAVEVDIVWEDTHVVVIDKPPGLSSVPYELREQGTAMDAVRSAWRRMGRRATETPLHVVHRIDKDTSGLLLYAKTKRAERVLAAAFRAHTIERTYQCVAHGDVRSGRIESMLVPDRGDGLRGSTRRPGQGKRAVTHVRALEALFGATLCEVKLETGKTHQIRIHLAESGHPLVGERVYVRDFLAAGATPLASPRLLLHAATLGFAHPVTGLPVRLEATLPPSFTGPLARLRLRARPGDQSEP